jgi:hypothetical protein
VLLPLKPGFDLKGPGHVIYIKNATKIDRFSPKEGTRQVLNFFRDSSSFIKKKKICGVNTFYTPIAFAHPPFFATIPNYKWSIMIKVE